ncbi:MAG: hypothetical protein M3417_06870 [Actinomycetota bacterium]|nr:hypothetical protein [Actinomycetota bacterium]
MKRKLIQRNLIAILVAGAAALSGAGLVGHAAFAENAPPERFVYLEAEGLLPALESFASGPTGTEEQAIARRQNNCCGVNWSGRAQVLFENFTPNARMTLRFEIPESAEYSLGLVFTRAPNFGIYEFSIDGRRIGDRYDGYAPAVERSEQTGLGSVELAKGSHTLTLTVPDKNPASSNYFGGLDYVELRTPGAARDPQEGGAGQPDDPESPPGAQDPDSDTPGSQVRPVRRAPRLSVRVSPATDRRQSNRFKISGRLGLPAGIRPADGCQGRVTIQVKAGKDIVDRRRTSVTRACTFSQRVTFGSRRQFGARKRVVVVRFAGNRFLMPTGARTMRVG